MRLFHEKSLPETLRGLRKELDFTSTSILHSFDEGKYQALREKVESMPDFQLITFSPDDYLSECEAHVSLLERGIRAIEIEHILLLALARSAKNALFAEYSLIPYAYVFEPRPRIMLTPILHVPRLKPLLIEELLLLFKRRRATIFNQWVGNNFLNYFQGKRLLYFGVSYNN